MFHVFSLNFKNATRNCPYHIIDKLKKSAFYLLEENKLEKEKHKQMCITTERQRISH